MPDKTRRRFSERYEVGRPPAGLVYEIAPEPLRDGFLNLLEDALTSTHSTWTDAYRAFLKAIDRWVAVHPPVLPWKVGDLVRTCDWADFFNMVEATAELYAWPPIHDRSESEFVNSFNDLLRRHYMGYELRNWQIERVGAREAEIAIAEARGILHDPDLAGPDEQFQKAIGFFNRRPNPDVENCVKDAVGAVEALAGILLNDPSILLSKALIRIGQEKGVAATLCKLIGDLYAYRGDAPGAAHGKTSTRPPVRVEDAEFVLHTSAACIVYLARLYGRAVE